MAVPSFMPIAIEEARAAAARGEVPAGCAIVRGGTVIARAGNRPLPTAIQPRMRSSLPFGQCRRRLAANGSPIAIFT